MCNSHPASLQCAVRQSNQRLHLLQHATAYTRCLTRLLSALSSAVAPQARRHSPAALPSSPLGGEGAADAGPRLPEGVGPSRVQPSRSSGEGGSLGASLSLALVWSARAMMLSAACGAGAMAVALPLPSV